LSRDQSPKASPDIPDLDQLAAMIESDGPSSSVEADGGAEGDRDGLGRTADQASSAEGSSTARANSESAAEVDDDVPTDYFHAVKPKPKAVPIADVGTSDQEPLGEPDDEPGRRVWPWILAAFVLTLVLATAGWMHHRSNTKQVSGRAPLAQRGKRADRDRSGREAAAGREQRGRDDLPAARDVPAEAFEQTAKRFTPAQSLSVRFERRGQAILVPVRLTGPSGSRAVEMVLDTGATHTTVTRRTLSALGVAPSGVSAEVETANGIVTRPLAVVDAIAVEQAAVGSGLTVGVCDRCATAGAEGLLGLNFARHFVMTVDHEDGQLRLVPKALEDKTIDIRPFVVLLDAKTRRQGERVTIAFVIRNQAPRMLREIVIEAASEGLTERPQTVIANLPGGSRRQARIEGVLPARAGALTFTLEVVRASW
jgi:predicted aspartyl protease